MSKRLRVLLAGCMVACACSASPAQDARQPGPLPSGAKVEPSGYWTIISTPNSPAQPRTPPTSSGKTIYAEIAGVSNEEAEKRRKAQEATRPEFERLMRRLRTAERGNYTDAELIHRPDWAYLIYFKRNPAATLAKYTKNPRFHARAAPYTTAELERLIKPWIDRLQAERLFTGFGLNARQGRADIDMLVSEEEYAAIAKRKGWGEPPAFINLKFDEAPKGLAVHPAVAPRIRIFAQSDRNMGLVHQMAIGGRIVLRDGCFFVISFDGSEKLAYFGREVGLGVYGDGYLSLFSRTDERRHLGRIGENFTWAGPIAIDETAPMVKELRARCGNAPLMHLGIPESSSVFNARYGLPRAAPPPPPPAPPRPELKLETSG